MSSPHQVFQLLPSDGRLLLQHGVGQHVERSLHHPQFSLQWGEVVGRGLGGQRLQGGVHSIGPGDLGSQHHQLGLVAVNPLHVLAWRGREINVMRKRGQAINFVRLLLSSVINLLNGRFRGYNNCKAGGNN